MTRRTRIYLTALAVIYAIGSLLLPLPAWVLAIVTLGVWTHRLARRWGIGAALAITYLVGTSATYLVLLASHLSPLPFQLAVVALNTACLVGAILTARPPMPPADDADTRRSVVFGAVAGPIFWFGGLAVAALTPGSSFRSWSMWDDSSFDVRAVTRFAWNNGVTLGNPRPFEHAISLSLVPPSQRIDNSPSEFLAELGAHAWHWTLVIGMGAYVCGVLAAKLVPTTAPLWVKPLAAGLGSTVVLAGPAAGAYIFRGQINASIVILVVAASLLIAIESRRAPVKAITILVLATMILMLTWTPFAAVPGALVVAVAWHEGRSLRLASRYDVIALVAALGSFALSAYLFAVPEFRSLSEKSQAELQSLMSSATAVTEPMPVSYWLVGTLITAAVVSMAVLRKRNIAVAWVGPWLVGLGIGASTLFITRGGVGGELAYYPSRFLHMATIALAPVAIGLVLGAVTRASIPERLLAGAAAAAAVTVAVLAPVPHWIHKWKPVPYTIVMGRYFGPDEYVYNRLVESLAQPELQIPVVSAGAWDHPVRYMLAEHLRLRSVVNHSNPLIEAIRFLEDTPDGLCQLGRYTYAPVHIVTRAANLREAVALACADPTWDDHFEYIVRGDSAA